MANLQIHKVTTVCITQRFRCLGKSFAFWRKNKECFWLPPSLQKFLCRFYFWNREHEEWIPCDCFCSFARLTNSWSLFPQQKGVSKLRNDSWPPPEPLLHSTYHVLGSSSHTVTYEACLKVFSRTLSETLKEEFSYFGTNLQR